MSGALSEEICFSPGCDAQVVCCETEQGSHHFIVSLHTNSKERQVGHLQLLPLLLVIYHLFRLIYPHYGLSTIIQVGTCRYKNRKQVLTGQNL